MKRTFRLRGRWSGELLLVGWPGVRHYSAEQAAIVLREWCAEDSSNAGQIVAMAAGSAGGARSLEDAITIVARLVADGSFAMIEVEPDALPGIPIFGRSRAEHGGDWENIPRLAELRESDPTFTFGSVSVELVHETGIPFAGREIKIKYGHGGSDRAVLDDLGRWSNRSTPIVGLPRVVFPKALELTELERSIGPRDGFEIEPTDLEIPSLDAPELTLPRYGTHFRIVVRSPEVVAPTDTRTACVRMVGMLFELNKAFLLPPALEGIRILAHMYEKMPGAEILVVGHTDRTGKKYRNDSMSLERARAVIAYMTDDVDAWLACYGKDVDVSRRWGPTEDLAMLSALPRAAERPYYSEEHDEHDVPAAIRRFQTAHGLAVDGEAGPETRRALIREYMELDGTTLPAGTTAVAHGCGEFFPAVPTDDEVEELQNRRVEVFFFRDGIKPRPTSENSKPGSTEYPAWNDAVDEERTFTPTKDGRGTLLLATDIDAELAELATVEFRLASLDGLFEQVVDGGSTRVTATGHVLLEFGEVPRGSFLTLVALFADGSQEILLEDKPFPELAQFGPNESVVDPFTLGRPT